MADFDLFAMIGEIQDKYPDLMPILSKPGVFAALSDAIANNSSDAVVQSALRATDYYKNTPVETRQWDVLSATDPATANERGVQAAKMVKDTSDQLGINLNGADSFSIAAGAAAGGWDQNRVRYEILNGNYPSAGVGIDQPIGQGREVAQTAAQIKGIADSYAVPSSDENTMKWAREVAAGSMTLDAVKGSLQQWASALFPVLKSQLDAGQSVADFAAPYMQTAAQELGVNPNTINLSDPKWSGVFIGQDDKGNQKLNTMQEALSTIRTNPTYGYNQGMPAKQQAAQFATQLQQRFGVTG